MPGNGAKKTLSKTKGRDKLRQAHTFLVLHMWVINIPLQEALAHPIVGHILQVMLKIN